MRISSRFGTTATVAAIFLAVALSIVFYSKPIILKVLIGEARILGPPVNAKVLIDGKVSPSHLCFFTKSFSNNPSAEMLVIYDSSQSNGYNEVLIVDISDRVAGLPNAGEENYFLLWNNFLFQSESGAGWAVFSSPKFDYNDPQYVFEKHYCKFKVPEIGPKRPRLVEIQFEGQY